MIMKKLDDQTFDQIRKAIDQVLDSDATGQLGIAMSFELAGEFLVRDLLKIEKFKMLVNWESRTYRGHHVYPDPWMSDFTYRFGN